jgi:hypothetical protein
MRITRQHEEHYREHGYAIVERFCTPEELSGALADFDQVVPGWVDFVKDPDGPKPQYLDRPYPGQRGIPHFPYKGDALNDLSFHPELRRFATQNCGGAPVFCEQSHLSYKVQGQRGDQEQAMHLDYSNHTIAYPPNLPRYWQTAFLYYFTDVTEELAPTAVCSWKHYPEPILWPSAYKREDRPELYEHEVKTIVPAGSLLIYSMRTFHRGTAFTGKGGRLGMFVTYAPAGCPWMGIVGWSQEGPRPEFRHWMERASVEERTTLGFPEPGNVYWTAETLAGVAARYPGMDMTPYRQ